MNGAESLVRTLVAGGVDVCFANPGTSEMHFVAALDRFQDEALRLVGGEAQKGRHGSFKIRSQRAVERHQGMGAGQLQELGARRKGSGVRSHGLKPW